MNNEQEPTANAAAPFPQYTVDDAGIATITYRSANGYVHLIRCWAGEQLTFLKRCWPWNLDGSRGKKYISREGINLFKALLQRQNGTDIIIFTPDGWLRWDTVTFTKHNAVARQKAFENQVSFNRRLVKPQNRELAAAYNRTPKTLHREDYANDVAFEVAQIFEAAQVPPARPSRGRINFNTGRRHGTGALAPSDEV